MPDAAQPIQVPAEIRAVLIPLGSETLLLPNAAVAEVIGYQAPRALRETPNWLLGSIDWRQQNLPVVQLQHMLGKAQSPEGYRPRIVICHTLGEGAQRPFVGIVAQSIPRLVRVRETSLQGQPLEAGDDALVHARLTVETRQALIPDLSELERRVSEVTSRVT